MLGETSLCQPYLTPQAPHPPSSTAESLWQSDVWVIWVTSSGHHGSASEFLRKAQIVDGCRKKIKACGICSASSLPAAP